MNWLCKIAGMAGMIHCLRFSLVGTAGIVKTHQSCSYTASVATDQPSLSPGYSKLYFGLFNSAKCNATIYRSSVHKY